MKLVTTKDMLLKAKEGKYAVGAFNIDNVDVMQAVAKAAEQIKSPIIIAVSETALKFMHPAYIRHVAHALEEETTVPIALHLDHGKTPEVCKLAVDNGFTSVMIDASAYEFDKNVELTKEVVDYAHARGVTVEGELGAIAGIEDNVIAEDKYCSFTHPQEAVEFVKRTDVDSLAIAIGTAHGAYKFKPGQVPQLRFDILDEIKEALPNIPLVLHGASSVPHDRLETFNKYGGNMPEAIGIPEDMLYEAAKRGICKINVGSDVRICYFGELRKALIENPTKFNGPTFLVPAKEAVTQMVIERITQVMGSQNKA